MLLYKLNDHGRPVLCPDPMEFALWFGSTDRTIAVTPITKSQELCTSFIGIEIHGNRKNPKVWESMIFFNGRAGDARRFSGTVEEAEAYHRDFVTQLCVEAGAPVPEIEFRLMKTS